MKKFSIVLLALLLAGGFAFAAEIALDGEVSANFGLDFENSEYGFQHDNTQEFDLTWTAAATSSGEGDIYAEITMDDVELSFDSGDVDNTPSTSGDWEDSGWSFDTGDLAAKIVGPDWVIKLSSPTGFGNAESPDMDQDDDTDPEDSIDPGFDNSPHDGTGLTLNYMDARASVNYWNDGTTTFYAFSVGYTAELADGVTAGVDVGMDEEDFIGSITAGYVMDMLTVDAAMDFIYGTASGDEFGFDASVAATVTPVDDVEAYVAAYYEASNEEIDVFARATYTGVENTKISVWGYLNDSGAFDAASQGGSEEDLEAWSVGADVDYTIDIFTPYANVEFNAESEYGVKVGTKAALIDNATVDVNYEMSNIGVANLGGSNKNKLNASVTVSL